MFSKSQKIAFIVVTAVVVVAIGVVFSANTDKEIHEEKRDRGAIGKRTTREKTVWLNKAISFKKTTREKKEPNEPVIMEALPEEEEKKKPKKKTAKKADKKKDSDKKTTQADKKTKPNNNTVAVRVVDGGGGGPLAPNTEGGMPGGMQQVPESGSPQSNFENNPGSDYIAGGAVGMMPQQNNTNEPSGGTEQANLTSCTLSTLVGSPSLDATTRCIEEYSVGRVSETDFYSTVSSMLQDPNTLVRRHGLFALAQTQSPRSFQELVTQKNNSEFENVTTIATQSLNQYSSSPKRARTINQVLDGDDVLVSIEAIKVAKDLAQKYLSVEDSQQRDVASERLNIDPTEYEKMVVKLDEISKSSDEEELKVAATEAHSFIADLLTKYNNQNNPQDTTTTTLEQSSDDN